MNLLVLRRWLPAGAESPRRPTPTRDVARPARGVPALTRAARWIYSDWAAVRSLQALANQVGIALEPAGGPSVMATLAAVPPDGTQRS